MTLTYTAEQVRELVLADARRKNPGVLLAAYPHLEDHDYTVEILDQSPFGISPERVKRGFDEAREAVRRVDTGEGKG